MSLKKNVMANYAGQGWSALMGLVFIPLYIRYIGVEAYGLIGIFAILQTWFVLLDFGMSPALGREMARYVGGGHNARSICDLLRSVEVFGFYIACFIALVTWAAAGWLATNWLRPQELSVATITSAFTIMGLVAGLRFLENIYRSGLVGLQRQVMLNSLIIVIATLRGLGAVVVLAFVSSTIEAFFLWQALVSLVSVGLFSSVLHQSIDAEDVKPRFSWAVLRNIWRFAGGMLVILILAALLTQTDKILLSRLLYLDDFGYYTLASTVAGVLYMLPGPISQALYPKFTELVTRGDEPSLLGTFHKGAQLISVLMGSVAMLLIFFSDVLLALWTGDESLVQSVAPILSVLALGTLLNGMMWLPGQMQYAHGWVKPGIYINSLSVALFIPLLLWLVPRYGSIGAAWGWVLLNSGYLLIGAQFLFKWTPAGEKWRWYREDVLLPVLAAGVAAFTVSWLSPDVTGVAGQLGVLVIAGLCVLLSAVLVAPNVRRQIAVFVRNADYAT